MRKRDRKGEARASTRSPSEMGVGIDSESQEKVEQKRVANHARRVRHGKWRNLLMKNAMLMSKLWGQKKPARLLLYVLFGN